MSSVLIVRAFAKINLSLRVCGLRGDGYHDLRTVFQSIALADTLTFDLVDGPFRMSCNQDGIPLDERNLVWRAASGLWDLLGRPGGVSGISVTIDKQIPAQAGLGGGSADAAAALRALSHLWNAHLPGASLHRLAASLGADVPYFLSGGTALGLGRGDEIYPLVNFPRAWVVVACPAIGVSTVEAYRWHDDHHAPASAHLAQTSPPAHPTELWALDQAAIVNDLEPFVVRHHPAIGELVVELRAAGAAAAAMSGSGSAVFGLFRDRAKAGRAAKRLAGRARATWLTRTMTRAEYGRLTAPKDTGPNS